MRLTLASLFNEFGSVRFQIECGKFIVARYVSMVAITATLVKELRERTGSGMMECKKALQETQGDIEAAVEAMRKAGQAKADKKASRVAAEGLIVIRQAAGAAAMVEVNCETDFVTKNDDFREFAAAVVEAVLDSDPADLEALLALTTANGRSIEQNRRECIAKIGENINVRRFARLTTPAACWVAICTVPASACWSNWPAAMAIWPGTSPCMSPPVGRCASAPIRCRPNRWPRRRKSRGTSSDQRQTGQHRREDGGGAAAQVLR